MDTTTRLRQAIAFARKGQRSKSYPLLRQVVKANPQDTVAWLWLSYVARKPEEQIEAAEKVLELEPEHARARERLTSLHLQQIHTLSKTSRRQEAQERLYQFLQQHEQHEEGWMLASEVVDDIEDQVFALEKVLGLNPQHAEAQARLQQLQQLQADGLALGKMYEEQGRLDKAVEAYSRAYARVSASEREDINRRLAEIQERRHYFERGITRPTLSVLRLMTGPLLLYATLVFVQSGISFRFMSPFFCMGGLLVLVGSFLIEVTRAKPKPPFWYTIFRQQGSTREELARFFLEIGGWVLVAAPYLALIINAIGRFLAYEPPAPGDTW